MRTASAVDWLLESDEPAIRYLAARDVRGDSVPYVPEDILAGPKVRALMSGQQPNGGFGGHAYKKWAGAHWRLVSLVELAAPRGEPRLLAAADTVLNWLTGRSHLQAVRVIGGLARRCASQEGNALAVCSLLGMADDPRVELMARKLLEWQWPDGGWNCDLRATGYRSSFHESLPPAWGLHEYWSATGAAWAREASLRAAELFLSHRLFRKLKTGGPINPKWLEFHYPPYWHYDVLQALVVLGRIGLLGDERCADALDLVESRRRPDGRWEVGGYWWKPAGGTGQVEVVDWGRGGPNEMVTLNALRVLARAGR